MSKTFGEAIKERLTALNMRPSELARRANTSRQNIGRLINGVVHPITGAYPTADLATVEAIAKALNWNINEARLAAGYAPTEPQTRIQKLIAALEAQGIDGLSMFGGFTQLADMSDEQYEEVLRSIALVIDMSVQRSQQKDV